MKTGGVDDRQMRLLQEMSKFSKHGEQILSAPAMSQSQPFAGSSAKNNAPSAGSSTKNNTPVLSQANGSTKDKGVSSANQTPKKAQTQSNSSDVHFSGSAFLSSPDPSAIPLPNFSDESSEKNYTSPLPTKAAAKSTPNNSGSKGATENSGKPQTSEKKDTVGSTEVSAEDKSETLKRFLKMRRST